MVESGTILGGKYRLVERLGEGGMGSVWIGENLSIKGSEVAVKVLHGNFTSDPDSVRRFRQEAEAAVKIGHPNIVRVFDFGADEKGAPFLVMERLRGESLAERLERQGTLAPTEAVDILLDVLRALEAAHEHDILHRDLKPENIFLANQGERVMPKVLDFGVSKFLGDDAERVRMTRTGALIGTPAYMSPEQSLGESSVDLRSDIWALGVILYELLSGRLPYEGPNYNAVLVRIATGEAEPLDAVTKGLDPRLIAIVERAMARSRRERFASVRQLRIALERWRRGDDPEVSAPPRVVSGGATPRPSLDIERLPTLVDARVSTVPGRRSWGAAIGVGVMLATLVTGVVMRSARSTPALGTESQAAATMGGAVTPRHRLEIRGLPASAHVVVDDQTVMLPTFVREGDHRVRVDANGYRPWMRVVPDVRGDVSLEYAGTTSTTEPPHAVPALPPAPPLATHLPAQTPRPRPTVARRHRDVNSMVRDSQDDPYATPRR